MVSDLQCAKEFYTELLGFTIEGEGDSTVTLQTNGTELVLSSDFEAATLAEFGLEPPSYPRASGAVIVVNVDDLSTIQKEIGEKDGEILTPPADVQWGRRMMLIRDPDGYLLEAAVTD